MIVCSCNVFSDRDVRMALTAERTPTTASQVYGCLGCSAQCGRCASTIRRILASTYSNESAETNQRYTRAIVCMGRYGYRI
jgi:bacterioferritin-associated ferredoxin